MSQLKDLTPDRLIAHRQSRVGLGDRGHARGSVLDLHRHEGSSPGHVTTCKESEKEEGKEGDVAQDGDLSTAIKAKAVLTRSHGEFYNSCPKAVPEPGFCAEWVRLRKEPRREKRGSVDSVVPPGALPRARPRSYIKGNFKSATKRHVAPR